jgi:hypothetical protein
MAAFSDTSFSTSGFSTSAFSFGVTVATVEQPAGGTSRRRKKPRKYSDPPPELLEVIPVAEIIEPDYIEDDDEILIKVVALMVLH